MRLAPARTLRRIGEVYVEQARFLLPVALVLFVPLGLIEAWAEHTFELEAEEPNAAEVAGLIGAIVAQVAASSSLGEVFYAGVVMSAVSESMEGHRRPPIRTLLRTLPYGGLIVVDILFSFGLAFGLVLLVVPGLIFFPRYVLAAPLVALAHARGRAAVRRRPERERGPKLGLLLLLGGLWLATDLASGLLGEGGTSTLGESLTADWAIATVIELLITPVWAVAVCVVTWRLLHLEREANA